MPPQFSWIDQRLIRDGHIRGRTTGALALYLFLCTVADAQGISYYCDGSVCELLGLDCPGLGAARRELMDTGLVAYRRPFYQVLSLEAHKRQGGDSPPVKPPPSERTGEVQSFGQILRSMMEGRP